LGRFGIPDPGPGLVVQLPLDLAVNVPATVRFEISDDLPRWDKVGRVHEVLLRVRVENTTEIERLRFKLNGKELPGTSVRKINEIYRLVAPRYRVGSCYWFVFKLDRDHWPQRGHNTLEVTLLNRDPGVVRQISVRDVEMETKYLLGRSFHRDFVDPDLGSYEGRRS
jgi:hypothetical protein